MTDSTILAAGRRPHRRRCRRPRPRRRWTRGRSSTRLTGCFLPYPAEAGPQGGERRRFRRVAGRGGGVAERAVPPSARRAGGGRHLGQPLGFSAKPGFTKLAHPGVTGEDPASRRSFAFAATWPAEVTPSPRSDRPARTSVGAGPRSDSGRGWRDRHSPPPQGRRPAPAAARSRPPRRCAGPGG